MTESIVVKPDPEPQPGETWHLAMLDPFKPGDMYRLLNWDAPCGVPAKTGSGVVRQIFSDGMLCSLNDKDLEEAQSFCRVKILATKRMD